MVVRSLLLPCVYRERERVFGLSETFHALYKSLSGGAQAFLETEFLVNLVLMVSMAATA